MLLFPSSPAAAASTTAETPLPVAIGNYQVVRRLGMGGMAEVFLTRRVGGDARDLAVVKRIRNELVGSNEFRAMFLDEAKLGAVLRHPNLCHTYEFGIQDGRYFLAMEYLHGQNLNRIIKRATHMRHPIPLDCAVYIAVSVLMALDYAHDKTDSDGNALGIVHRDVNPSNIMIEYNGRVKLLDFGIAKSIGRHTQTHTGILKGKFRYMSPEQCRGRRIDRRADVFSLGVTLYRLTTGVYPFDGAGEVEIMDRILHRDPLRPSAVLPGFPPGLEVAIMRALRKDRDARYGTARAMAADLEAFAIDYGFSNPAARLSEYVSELAGKRTPSRSHGPRLLPVDDDPTLIDPRTYGGEPSESDVVIVVDEEVPECGDELVSELLETGEATASPSRTAEWKLSRKTGNAFQILAAAVLSAVLGAVVATTLVTTRGQAHHEPGAERGAVERERPESVPDAPEPGTAPTPAPPSARAPEPVEADNAAEPAPERRSRRRRRAKRSREAEATAARPDDKSPSERRQPSDKLENLLDRSW